MRKARTFLSLVFAKDWVLWYNFPVCEFGILERKIVLALKILLCILLCCPLAYIGVYLFSRLMEVILKKR